MKSSLMREWIIFALSIGLGGHIALGFLLHSPGTWSPVALAFYGFLTGILLYVTSQVGRAIWRLYQEKLWVERVVPKGKEW